jgi:hypothetical protein
VLRILIFDGNTSETNARPADHASTIDTALSGELDADLRQLRT